MLYTKKFVITVSLCAMLAANPVLAVTNPVEAKAAAKSGKPGEVSTVYSDWAGRAESGIAGVSYVNSAVDVAGNAAQWAENHAAIAAQNAASAAKSASDAAGSASDAAKVLQKAVLRPDDVVENSEPVGSATLPVYVKADGTVETITSYQGKATTAGTADKAIADKNGAQIDTTYEKLSNKVTTLSADSTDTQYPSAKLVRDELDKKVDKDQGVDNKNLAMVTDQKGTVYPGYITSDMIEKHSVSTLEIQGPDESVNVGPDWVLMGSGKSMTYWGRIGVDSLVDGAVTTDKIDNGAVTSEKIAASAITSAKIDNGAVTPAKIATPSGRSGVLFSDGSVPSWRMIGSSMLESGAVTIEKTAGVVGMVPVGSADATTYGQFWIE